MQLDKNKIKDITFSISTFSKKFRIAKNKSFVKGALETMEGIVDKSGGKCLIGKETINFYTAFTNEDYIFEGELEDRSYQEDFKYFKNFDLKFYDMMRSLLKTDNIRFSYIYIGDPVTEDEFNKLEKSLKRPIPKAVKEFYSLFGELRILWSHRNPDANTGVNASRSVWNMDYRDNHIGSFQMLPLKTILFEKWEDEKYCFDVGTNLKIFDFSTEYNMVALDITSEGNPLVYRGDDHGILFSDASPMSFTNYLDLCLGLYGTRERMSYFQTPGYTNNKSDKEIKDALAGKVVVDINNDAYLLPAIKEIITLVDKAISEKDYKSAQSHLMPLHNMNQPLFERYLVDLDRLNQNEEGFAKRISYLVKESNFAWEDYENQHKGDSIFESKPYLKAKKKFGNL